MNEQAKKNDDGKPRVDLVPFDAIEAAGEVLAFGAKKYDAWNWTQGTGLAWHRLARAALSHLGKWAMGEDKDPESGLSHLAHALCCLLFLVTYERRKHGVDDRPRLPWFAQNEGKDASSDTIPACGEPGVMHFEGEPVTSFELETDSVIEELALGDEVLATVAADYPRGGLQGRIVSISHPGKIRVRFTRDDRTHFELDFMRNNLRKVPKQEAPKRDDLTTCPHCGDPCFKGLGKCSPTCTAPDDRETPIPSSVPPAIVRRQTDKVRVCATCRREPGLCKSLGGLFECKPPQPYPVTDKVCSHCSTGDCVSFGGRFPCVPPAERRDEILARREIP